MKKVIFLHGGEALPEKYRLLLGGALVLYLVFGMLIDLVTTRSHSTRPPRTRAIWRFGAAASVGVVTMLGGSLSPVGFHGHPGRRLCRPNCSRPDATAPGGRTAPWTAHLHLNRQARLRRSGLTPWAR